jgi:hypothetical protein
MRSAARYRWPARFEAAWIEANVAPHSWLNDHVYHQPTVKTGYDVRGLPRFRVRAGRRLLDTTPAHSVA